MNDDFAQMIEDISGKVALDDFREFLSACKDDVINTTALESITSPKEWLEYLMKKSLLTKDDVSFIEHIFELCRRPDLLSIVMAYRMHHLANENEDQVGKNLVRISSAKKYFNHTDSFNEDLNEEEDVSLKLSAPPKTRRKSAA